MHIYDTYVNITTFSSTGTLLHNVRPKILGSSICNVDRVIVSVISKPLSKLFSQY